MISGVFRVPPLAGETTSSFLCRIAARYGLEEQALLSCWQWRNHRPRHEGGTARADAEVLLDAAGRQVLAGLCRVEEETLARALPAWEVEDPKLAAPEASAGQALWRVGGAVVGPVAFGCRLCAVRRTGVAGRVVRYAQRWERVCVRHGRWALDADADQPLEYLDLRGILEVAAAQRRWAGVTRRAARAGVGAGEVFGLAYAVVARWWEEALHWEREKAWPRRLHEAAGGDAGGDFDRWRIVGRDTVIFPELVAVADALLDPAMAELAWQDSGADRPRPLPVDGAFCRRLGERVGRPWLGPVVAADLGGPLIAWMGTVIRRRRNPGRQPAPFAEDPWWVRKENRPASMAAQLRVLHKEKTAGGSGTRWRTVVPAERRALITGLINEAEEQLGQLRGAQTGSTADVAQHLLQTLRHGAGLLDQALRHTAAAALNAGVPPRDVAQWAGLPADAVAKALEACRREAEDA